MGYKVVTVEIGHPGYEPLLGPVRADRALRRRMWLDAESNLDEAPGKQWVIAVVDGRAAAWAAAIVADGVLRCCDSYEAPAYRGLGLYEVVYRHRHDRIVQPWPGLARTFVFAQPLPLHVADGWRVVAEGVSRVEEPDGDGLREHRWYELHR